jgi:hypothetical protein
MGTCKKVRCPTLPLSQIAPVSPTPYLAKISVLYLSLGYNKAYIRLFTVGTHLFTNYVNISLKCLKILLKFLKPCVYI